MRIESEDKVATRICALMHAERKAKKISQQKLCESLGITQGLLSKIENGKLKPSVYVWLTFCKLFSMDAEVAMADVSFKKRLSQVKKQSIKKH
jgi:transcriptional regulator with XRE-family HTH domain